MSWVQVHSFFFLTFQACFYLQSTLNTAGGVHVYWKSTVVPLFLHCVCERPCPCLGLATFFVFHSNRHERPALPCKMRWHHLSRQPSHPRPHRRPPCSAIPKMATMRLTSHMLKKKTFFFLFFTLHTKFFLSPKKKKKKIYGREKQHIVHVKKKVAVKAIIA